MGTPTSPTRSASVASVLVWQAQELDAVLPQLPHRGHDVFGAQGDVLRAGVEVVVEELLDLALLLACRRFVDGELMRRFRWS